MLKYVLSILLTLQISYVILFAEETTSDSDKNFPVIIKSDYIEIDTEKRGIKISDVSTLEYKDAHLVGKNLIISLKDNYCEINDVEGMLENLKIKSEKIIIEGDKITIFSGKITTCKKEHAHYTIRSQKLTITEKFGRAKNTSLYLGKTRIFFIPYFIYYISPEKEKKHKPSFPIPSLSYDKDSGIQIKVEYPVQFIPDVNMHFLVEAEKKEGLMGGVNISYSPDSSTSIFISGKKTREKTLSNYGYVIIKLPEFLIEHKRMCGKNLSFGGSIKYERTKEEEKKPVDKKEVRIYLSKNYPTLPLFSLSLYTEGNRTWYRKKERDIFTYGINLLKKYDKGEITIGYIKRNEIGTTPLLYDRIDAQNEILVGKKFTTGRVENRLNIRYDLQKKEFIEYVYSILNVLDCFKWGVALKYKEDKIWSEIKITLL